MNMLVHNKGGGNHGGTTCKKFTKQCECATKFSLTEEKIIIFSSIFLQHD